MKGGAFGHRKPGFDTGSLVLTQEAWSVQIDNIPWEIGRANKSRNSWMIFLGEIRVRIEIAARIHWLANMELVSEQLIIYMKNFHSKFPFLTSTSFFHSLHPRRFWIPYIHVDLSQL